jgi:hypothetical protein
VDCCRTSPSHSVTGARRRRCRRWRRRWTTTSRLICGHAAWALGRIRTDAARSAMCGRQGAEEDEWVRKEMESALEEARPRDRTWLGLLAGGCITRVLLYAALPARGSSGALALCGSVVLRGRFWPSRPRFFLCLEGCSGSFCDVAEDRDTSGPRSNPASPPRPHPSSFPRRSMTVVPAATTPPERCTAMRRADLLDTPGKAGSDRLACRVLDAPVALISLLDEPRSRPARPTMAAS